MTAPQDLSIRQLQYVVAVAETLGFHRAAARANVSQPTLSAQVRELEHTLGVQLFERDRHKVLVTPAGELVVARARHVLATLEDLLTTALRVRDPFDGVLRIGVIPTVAPYLLPELTQAALAAYPKLRLALREGKTGALAGELREGTLDAAIVALHAEGLDGFAHAPILSDPFVFAMPAGHRLARARTKIDVGALDSETVLLLDDGHCLRTHALAICKKARTQEADIRATSLTTLVQMVSSGAGVTLLPRLSLEVENRRAQLAIRTFAPPVPTRTIALVWRQDSPLAAPLDSLATTFRRAAQAGRSDDVPSGRTARPPRDRGRSRSTPGGR